MVSCSGGSGGARPAIQSGPVAGGEIRTQPLSSGVQTAWLSVVDDWYEPGSRKRQAAWVVQWVADDDGRPMMNRALVELIEGPPRERAPTADLIQKAETVVSGGPPTENEQRPKQRAYYERHLSGRDVLGTVVLSDILIEAEHLFGRLLRESDNEESQAEARV